MHTTFRVVPFQLSNRKQCTSRCCTRTLLCESTKSVIIFSYLSTGVVFETLLLDEDITCLGFNSFTNTLWVGLESGRIEIVDADSLEHFTLPIHELFPQLKQIVETPLPEFSSFLSGMWLVTADGTISLLDSVTGFLIDRIQYPNVQEITVSNTFCLWYNR